MGLSNEVVKGCYTKIIKAKSKILVNSPFYGELIGYLNFGLDDDCSTACTDGKTIFFGPEFLQNLNDKEIIFVMLHELMHCILAHCERGKGLNNLIYNIACDIVVNSILLEGFNEEFSRISINGHEAMHAYKNKEGRYYTAEELYSLLMAEIDTIELDAYLLLDEHEKWSGSSDESDTLTWGLRLKQAIDNSKICGDGSLPDFARQYDQSLVGNQVDWHKELHEFIQAQIEFNYSWQRPDKRYINDEIFLPLFCEEESSREINNIFFFVDISGSVDDEMVSQVMGEIKNAILMFDGQLKGKLGFFDTEIIKNKLYEFSDVQSFNSIIPQGCGGTSYDCIFRYFRDHKFEKPRAIIILTDGFCIYPQEDVANVPVLWIINNEDADEPPFGRCVRIKK